MEEPWLSWMLLVARACLASVYFVSAVQKTLYFPISVKAFRAVGVPFAHTSVVLTVILHFVGSIGMFSGTYVEECAIALALFTVVATLIVHDFWNLEGQERMADQRIFLAHFGVIGGLLMVVAVGPGAIVF